MTFSEFIAKCQNYPIIRSNLFPLLSNNPALLRRQVSEWIKKKWLIELKRGMYLIADSKRRCPVSSEFIANYLNSPSYISLDSALSHYRLIPERVEAVTSVTSKKTQRYQNALGYFIYRHIKQSSYRMFQTEKDDFGLQYSIATPEKAMIDYIYLNTATIKNLTKTYFSDSMRLQNANILDPKKLMAAAHLFNQKKLVKNTKVLISYLEEII